MAGEALCVPLQALDRTAGALAGGKGANLGALIRAGVAVPAGFCVTTAAYEACAAAAGLGPLVEARAPDAAAIRERLLATPVPHDVRRAIRGALQALDPGAPVAVRSSATAEDLPAASFAGQQDTFLNVLGPEQLLDAVRRCWASLWTDRAVAYRAASGVDHREVRLAVVVQRLVAAEVAGVLFTANPITGNRGQSVVDASPGLGEAVVSGEVNPDHFLLDTATGRVLDRRLGDRRVVVAPAPGGGTRRAAGTAATTPCLADSRLAALAAVGRRVQAHFGAPQDIEFALDAAGELWLLQSRPITTLYPLPPAQGEGLRVYWSLNVMQGVLRPFTPMGLQAFRLLGASAARLAGSPPHDPLAGPAVLAEAGGRLFLDITPLLAGGRTRRAVLAALAHVEARSGALLARVAVPARPPRLAPFLLRVVVRTRLPLRVLAALGRPAAARAAAVATRDAVARDAAPRPGATAAERLDLAEGLLLRWPARLLPLFAAPVIVGLGSLALAARLAGGAEPDALRRALPHNPTTEMDLALWKLARRLREDPASVAALREGAGADLSPALRRGLEAFLQTYGHRGVAEIDLGLPRWSDDPSPLLAALANYVLRADPAERPDARFRAAAAEADAAAAALIARAARRGRLRALAVRFLLRRGRALAGMRELPKFMVVYLFSRVRALVLGVGGELAAAGRLAAPGDVFFVDLRQARDGVAGADLRPAVAAARADYERECRRRHVPRVLLSDGTDLEAAAPPPAPDGALRGTPASAGTATGRARVVVDPHGARLDPGDILVAPSTDPGWTPLFLTAGALVMEMGGAMSHGAVVAREYGIPAVVGVPAATARIRDGEVITVDGAAGTVARAQPSGGRLGATPVPAGPPDPGHAGRGPDRSAGP